MEKFPIGNAIGGFAAIIAAKRRILLRQQQEKVAAKGGAKAHGVCRPGRDKLSEGKLQRRQGRRKRGRRAAKDLIGLVRSRCLGALIRGLQNLESSRKGKRIYSFRLYEKNQKYPRGLRTSGLRGRFKALSKKISAKFSDGTRRTRLFARNGGEKALNRCDVQALQRKELERTAKEWPYSFADSRLWLGANGRWRAEKGCFECNKERPV